MFYITNIIMLLKCQLDMKSPLREIGDDEILDELTIHIGKLKVKSVSSSEERKGERIFEEEQYVIKKIGVQLYLQDLGN
ncbi:unnamed protein product [Lupinus luteus]|uniref:Uncharacterized protein n=1 Tax=Lupinus luteus TaxID=3873 RepID=A0AAV1XPJ4_LUPLU